MHKNEKQAVALINALHDYPEMPWPLQKLHGRALVWYTCRALFMPQINEVILLLPSRWHESFKQVLGPKVTYWVLEDVRDFGQAILQAEDHFKNSQGDILLADARQPLLPPDFIRALMRYPLPPEAVACIPSVSRPAQTDGYWGMELNEQGHVVRICSREENIETPQYTALPWRFEWDCLQRALYQVENARGERPLHSVIEKVLDNGFIVTSIPWDNPQVVLTVNNPQEYLIAEKFVTHAGES